MESSDSRSPSLKGLYTPFYLRFNSSMASNCQHPCFWDLLYLFVNPVHFLHVSMGVSPDSSLSILQSSYLSRSVFLHPAEAGRDAWTTFARGEEGGPASQ